MYLNISGILMLFCQSVQYFLEIQNGISIFFEGQLLILIFVAFVWHCRYKADHPDCNQRQIAEYFTKLWNKEICRRRVSDILIQKEKWFEVERRVKGDADKTFRDGKFSNLEKLVYEWIVDVVR